MHEEGNQWAVNNPFYVSLAKSVPIWFLCNWINGQ